MDKDIVETREFELKLHNFTKHLLNVEKIVSTESFSIFLGLNETKW